MKDNVLRKYLFGNYHATNNKTGGPWLIWSLMNGKELKIRSDEGFMSYLLDRIDQLEKRLEESTPKKCHDNDCMTCDGFAQKVAFAQKRSKLHKKS